MNPLVLVAHNVRSTHNVGSFFRTADAFAAQVGLIGITPHPKLPNDARLPHIYGKIEKDIAKTALGAEKTVPWHYFQTLEEACLYYRKHGFKLVALEQAATAVSLHTVSNDAPTALFVGPEVAGFSADELALFDAIAEIPMLGSKESLNVAVAAGIGLYQLRH